MDQQDLRLLAAERAIVELSAVMGSATRQRALAPLVDELATATGDELDVLQAAIDLIRDGKLLGDALRLARWLRE